MTTAEVQTTQVYRIVIKATPEAIWEAITTPEFTERFFFGSRLTVAPDRYLSFSPDGDVGPTRASTSSTRRASSCTAGARATTTSWPTRPRAASRGRSSRRTTAPACSPSSTTGWRAPRRRLPRSPAAG